MDYTRYLDWITFHITTKKNQLVNSVKFNCYPDPFETILVDPTQIEYSTLGLEHIDSKGIGRVEGGEWDMDTAKVETYWVVQGLYERFEGGNDWKNTIYYETAKSKFEQNPETTVRGATSLEEFLTERCTFVERLYNDIKENGYKTVDDDTEIFRGHYKDNLEILVAIGRNGELYMHKGGFHRFTLARILGIMVPVHVVCRHKQWQTIRDEICSQGIENYTHLQDHPDIQDILN